MSSQDYYDSQYEYNMTDDEYRRHHHELREKKEIADMLAAAAAAPAQKVVAPTPAAAGAAGQKLKNLNLSNVPQRIILGAIELLKEHGAF
jgi:hypothetical protein